MSSESTNDPKGKVSQESDNAADVEKKHEEKTQAEKRVTDKQTPVSKQSEQQAALDKLAKSIEASKSETDKQRTSDKKTADNETKPTMNKAPVASQKAQTASSSSSKPLVWLLVLFNLGFLAAIAYAGFLGWQHWQQFLSNQEQQSAQLQQNLQEQFSGQFDRALQQQQSDMNSRMKQQSESVDQALIQYQSTLNSLSQQVQQVSGLKTGEWLLAEADYLVRMAGRKLWLEKDSATAISLLRDADSRLAEANDPELLMVRQALANDVEALRSLQVVSVTDSAIRLQALYSRVADLAIPQPETFYKTSSFNDVQATGFWAKLGQWVSDNLFRVSYTEQPVSPFINEQQQWLVKEQLKYQLLIAQNALLREEFALYRAAIEQSQNLLTQYFDLQQTAAVAFLESLNELSQQDFASGVPQELAVAKALKLHLANHGKGSEIGTHSDKQTIENASEQEPVL
ncbi:uroporphyrinogen-III C-methyltransferase [Paraneptunicella aestuarii]|uniref:uroporphyrinogen-III C-methyltransferase n=1 Tax=Paraneptunicella aestuarii TaxID=2831148 RepID=UPI001E4CFB1D|nr:uroporphyrinogen-III C-methyltransferase [Paraneptunicella aestuarii]UAA38376.1 uroporphyrinogen-III C-methyltransferase [Paraneptunicella aestuarii]